jgi:predicted DNA-binding transcriptional regulator AlpA
VNEREMKVKILYQKYDRFMLDIKEMAEEIKVSYSTITKIFHKKSEKEIEDNNLLPKYIKVGERRLWNISAILDWMENTENKKITI